jgi:D,D-heptose 1,7-bisphosphate phosphatase
MNVLSPAVFLDKDGTLIEDLPYNVDVDKIRFMPGVVEGLRALHKAGFTLIVATNQSGVARGFFNEDDLVRVERHLKGMMRVLDVPLTAFYYCPHLPGGVVPGYNIRCSCRKPEPGLIVRACREHPVDILRSWFVGDILNDIEAGRRAGLKTVLIDKGKETEWQLSPLRLPHHVVADFAEAAQVITTLSRTPAASVSLPVKPVYSEVYER